MAKWNPKLCQNCARGQRCIFSAKWQCIRSTDEKWVFSDAPINDVENKLQVLTSRIDYIGPDGLNVTRKSGTSLGKTFAPSWSILRPALEGLEHAKTLRSRGLYMEAQQIEDQTWELYSNLYTQEMRESYKNNQVEWKQLLGMRRVVLLCYCKDANICHRSVLANILIKCGAVYNGEVSVST